ncbi:hypothetical protein QCA50_017365 [Cerrena zonata]|uniref:AB hydrolase-1 domain-containing protein n=1 Tax=Cerrena zonata TaxID=2478898 RepID=A0AAW0FQ80_9APHY
MPLAPTDTKGTALFYEDSGAPPNSLTYRTVVLLHGGYFNSGIFKPSFAYATRNNLRLIAVNKRDYTGSTLYTNEELAELTSSDEVVRIDFMKKRVVELANLMIWLIENDIVLEPTQEGGGLSFATWSSGNCLAMPFLALVPELVDERSLGLIRKYLRSYIMYDAPTFPHGLSAPVANGKHYCPIGDPSLTPLDMIQGFPSWISGFYNHSSFAIAELVSPIDSPSRFQSDEEYIRELALECDADVPPTIQEILVNGPETCEPVPQVARTHVQLLFVGYPFYSECRRKVFLDGNSDWPKLRKEIVVCGRGVGLSLYAAWELKQRIQETGQKLAQDGLVRIHVLEEFNHMSHWDQPERFVQLLVDTA